MEGCGGVEVYFLIIVAKSVKGVMCKGISFIAFFFFCLIGD